jgi:hypothetical protein
MDRVFNNALDLPAQTVPADTIEVDVREETTASAGLAGSWTRWWASSQPLQPQLLLAAAGSILLLTGATSFALWRGWTQANLDLRQERTLRLLEGIRGLASPAATTTTPTTTSNAKSDSNAAAADLPPPPPPGEPWIEELSQLPAGASPGGAPPLRVPVSGTLNAPPPPASASAAASSSSSNGSGATAGGNLPELLGVVQIPGKPGSAIFQVGGSSTNALVGEGIGSSGWRLQSASGDSAVIERAGVTRRISISSGF